LIRHASGNLYGWSNTEQRIRQQIHTETKSLRHGWGKRKLSASADVPGDNIPILGAFSMVACKSTGNKDRWRKNAPNFISG
jgi:hypothetical protein